MWIKGTSGLPAGRRRRRRGLLQRQRQQQRGWRREITATQVTGDNKSESSVPRNDTNRKLSNATRSGRSNDLITAPAWPINCSRLAAMVLLLIAAIVPTTSQTTGSIIEIAPSPASSYSAAAAAPFGSPPSPGTLPDSIGHQPQLIGRQVDGQAATAAGNTPDGHQTGSPDHQSNGADRHRHLVRQLRNDHQLESDQMEANDGGGGGGDDSLAGSESNHHEPPAAIGGSEAASNSLGPRRLRIVRLFAPEAVQNGTQNVTLDCMFKFDRKLDQRLTIKWFFEDELEPIYQWIPELNKRVYSDKYERFIDKSYQVTEDTDFMLQSYKQLLNELPLAYDHRTTAANEQEGAGDSSLATSTSSTLDDRQFVQPNEEAPTSSLQTSANLRLPTGGDDDDGDNHNDSDQPAAGPHQQHQTLAGSGSNRRLLLANRLNRLAKFGSGQSRQLLESLRASLALDRPDSSRFRALRLIRPTSELSGRFTCSVSSLDGDDLRSLKLVVYEPAKSFTFNVSRVGHAYNLSCQAGPTFPRPSLNLYRFRATPVASGRPLRADPQPALGAAAAAGSSRPKLAATALRQEPIGGQQTQLTAVGPASLATSMPQPLDQGSRPVHEEEEEREPRHNRGPTTGEAAVRSSSGLVVAAESSVYEIAAWALVDESSLSGNLITQFECVLAIEGANYEQRQSLALQKGWHIAGSQPLIGRQSLVGLFSVLISLLCLILALVSSMLIFKLMRRQVSHRRVHQAKQQHLGRPNGLTVASQQPDQGLRSGSAAAAGEAPTASEVTEELDPRAPSDCSTSSTTAAPGDQVVKQQLAPSNQGHYSVPPSSMNSSQPNQLASMYQADFCEGIYRIPTNGLASSRQPQYQRAPVDADGQRGSPAFSTTFGTRLIIGQPPHSAAPGPGAYPNRWFHQQQLLRNSNQTMSPQQQHQMGATITGGQPMAPLQDADQQPIAATKRMASQRTSLPFDGQSNGLAPPPTTTNSISVNGRPLYC